MRKLKKGLGKYEKPRKSGIRNQGKSCSRNHRPTNLVMRPLCQARGADPLVGWLTVPSVFRLFAGRPFQLGWFFLPVPGPCGCPGPFHLLPQPVTSLVVAAVCGHRFASLPVSVSGMPECRAVVRSKPWDRTLVLFLPRILLCLMLSYYGPWKSSYPHVVTNS